MCVFVCVCVCVMRDGVEGSGDTFSHKHAQSRMMYNWRKREKKVGLNEDGLKGEREREEKGK